MLEIILSWAIFILLLFGAYGSYRNGKEEAMDLRRIWHEDQIEREILQAAEKKDEVLNYIDAARDRGWLCHSAVLTSLHEKLRDKEGVQCR